MSLEVLGNSLSQSYLTLSVSFVIDDRCIWMVKNYIFSGFLVLVKTKMKCLFYSIDRFLDGNVIFRNSPPIHILNTILLIFKRERNPLLSPSFVNIVLKIIFFGLLTLF